MLRTITVTLLFFLFSMPEAYALNSIQKAQNYNKRAFEYIEKNDIKNAQKYFKMAVESDPKMPLYAYNLGVTHSMFKEYDKELEVYAAVIKRSTGGWDTDAKINNVLADIYFNMACAYLKRDGDKVKALESLQIATDKYYTKKLLDSMKTDKDIDIIREEEQFKALLKKLDHIIREVEKSRLLESVAN